MSRKPRPNVTPEDVGKWYTDGKEVFVLIDCQAEPTATMRQLPDGVPHTKPLSQFANMVRLLPEHSINKFRGTDKAPRKRKEKGGAGTITPKKTDTETESAAPITPKYAESLRQAQHLTCPNCKDKPYCVKTGIPALDCWTEKGK